jgi:Glycerophosphoryl diester phosphodiesterase family
VCIFCHEMPMSVRALVLFEVPNRSSIPRLTLPASRHRGSGASKVKDHHVRENTILSFLKAATNHTDFIEFDVHVCKASPTAATKDVLKHLIPVHCTFITCCHICRMARWWCTTTAR